MSGRKPLEGVKVVDLSTQVAAPTCGKLLADFGAEVIKVESPSGDLRRTLTYEGLPPVSHYFPQNSGKKHVCLDLKNPEAMKIMHQLLSDADVFLTNVRFPALKRLGLDHETIRAKYPSIIYAIITAYGEKGEESNYPGFDSVAFWAKSGAMRDHSPMENPYPTLPSSSTGDSVACLALYSSILTALYKKQATGEGDYCVGSLYNSGAWMYATEIIDAQEASIPYPKSIYRHGFTWAPYKCQDGEYIQICLYKNALQVRQLMQLTGIDKWQDYDDADVDNYTRINNAEIHKDLEQAFLKKPVDEWVQILRDADIPANKIFHHLDVIKDPQAWVNDYLMNWTTLDGRDLVLVKSPLYLESSEDCRGYAETGGIGEDTEECLQKLGYNKEQIKELAAKGAVVCKDK